MTIHPLRLAYIEYVRQHYEQWVNGDPNPARTEVVAQKVIALGIDYPTYIEIAVTLWHRWAKMKGWNYPYWNAVTSDNSIDRVRKALVALGSVLDMDASRATEFSHELAYVMDYVDWWLAGCEGAPPKRSVPVPVAVQVDAAEYVCMINSVTFVSSELAVIANAIEARMADAS